MATTFVIDGKPHSKQRLTYIPREGEVIELKEKDGKTKTFIVDFVQHRVDLFSSIGIVDTLIHLKSIKKAKGD